MENVNEVFEEGFYFNPVSITLLLLLCINPRDEVKK
jgi:hypothetical protein